MRWLRAAATLVLVQMVFWSSTTAVAKEDRALRVNREEGAAAPANTWLMTGGCPARTNESLTEPVVGEMEIAWTMKVPRKMRGKVIETPLLWHERVFVPLRHGDNRHSIHVLNLHDGSDVVPPLILDSPVSLKPSLWNDRILLQTGSNQLTLYQILRGKLRKVWEVETGRRVYDVFLYDGKVYARVGNDLVTYKPPRKTAESLSTYGLELHGRMAMRGGVIYCMHYDGVGNSFLVGIDGREPRGFFVGHHGRESAPGEAQWTRIVAGATDLLVHHGAPVRVTKTRSVSTTGIRRDMWRRSPGGDIGRESAGFDGRNLFDFVWPVSASGPDWFGVRKDKKGQWGLIFGSLERDGAVKANILASQDRLPQYTRSPTALSSCGGVLYIGASAVRASDWRVLWEGDLELSLPPVPAKNKLLVVTKSGVLHALAPKGSVKTRGVYFGPLAQQKTPASLSVTKGLVVHSSGDEHNKPYEISCKDGTCVVQTSKTKKKTYKLGELRLLLDDKGFPLYAESLSDFPIALDGHFYYGQADDWRKLAKDSYKAGDPELMERLIGEAESRGVPERQLRVLHKMHQGLIDRPRKKDDKKIKRILERAINLNGKQKEAVAKALVKVLVEDPRREVQLLALRELIKLDPNSSMARTAVKERLPEFMRPKGDFSAKAWFDVAAAIEGKPFRSVLPPLGSAENVPPGQAELGKALKYWNKDLVAFETDQLMIMTPLREPGPIARCLVLGDLVCRALEDVFGGTEDSAVGRYPLILQLFDTRDAYLRFIGDKLGEEDRKALTGSAGHYDPDKGMSRIYLPDGDEGWEQTMETYAHELTHHWIDFRCPLFRYQDVRSTAASGGMWIVEGMAELLAEFRWDLGMRTWESFNRQSTSLDLIANIDKRKLLRWDYFFKYSYRDFQALDRRKTTEVPLRWKLGFHSIVTHGQMFYAQAGAACQYLYHQGGKLRDGLRKYVKAYYTGEIKNREDAIQKYFGMSPQELGRRIEAFAKEVSDGKFTPLEDR